MSTLREFGSISAILSRHPRPFGWRSAAALPLRSLRTDIGTAGDGQPKTQPAQIDSNKPASQRGLRKVGKSLRISEQNGGFEQEVEFRNERGRITRTYERNRHQSPVDAQAQAWISAMLGTILHETAINVAPRVARLHSRGGISAVLDAIAGIGSDYEKSSVLVTLAIHMPSDSELIAQYREIARGLGDHERGRAERALDGLVL